MASIRDIEFGRLTNSLSGGPSINLALSEVAGLDLARLAAEYDAFINSDVITRSADDFTGSNRTLSVGQGGVVIEAVAADGDGAALLAQLEALGLSFGGAFKNAVSGLFPIANLDQLPAVANIAFASASYVDSRVGSVANQADVAMNTDDLRSDFGIDGSGVTIGILSDSFDTAVANGNASIDYADDIASGDLPAGINVLLEYNQFDASDEGRAMAQLIHDVAPGATLEFASAFFGPAAFAQSIQDLAVNSDVIVDDIGYLTQPFFQDGVIAQAVDTVFAGGDAYFSAAGNSARDSYESAFRETATSVLFGATGQWHDFDPGAGVDLLQDFVLGSGQEVRLSVQWDDPYLSGAPGSGGALTNLDVAIFNTDTGAMVASGVDNNIGGDPFEFFNYVNTSGGNENLAIAISNEGGPTPNVVKYIDFGSGATSGADFFTNSGTSFGHPSAEGGLGIAAAFYLQTPEFGVDPALLENFSSVGDTPIFFDAAGNRLATPETRERIDVTAPDGTDTTFFGGDADGNGFPNFFGTSAAAPHAAALAALMLEADGTLSPTEIYDALKNSAIDILNTSGGVATGVGYDNFSGHGLIDGPAAFTEAGITAGNLVVDIAVDEDDGDTSAGDLSLREAIGIAQITNQNIVFDAALGNALSRLDDTLGTIDITGGQFTIKGSNGTNGLITITGDSDGDDQVTVLPGGNFVVTDATINASDSDNIQLFNITGSGTHVMLENLVLTGGVSSTNGGAISINNNATLTIDESIIAGNKAARDGGSLFNGRGLVTITDSSFIGNVAGDDGGAFANNDQGNSGTGLVSNSTFSGNQAIETGGAIYNIEGDLEISNTTITNNSAAGGSGVAGFGDGATNTTITSSIIAGNSGSEDLRSIPSPSDTIVSGGNNVIGFTQNAGDFTDGVNGDQVGTSGAPLDPMLNPLADNGGLMPTHAPMAGSPIIDAGSNPNGLATDQIGGPRVQGIAADVGALETALLPDLIVSNFTMSTLTPTLGQLVNFTWDAENIGGGTSGTFDTGVYLSTDMTIDPGTDRFLGFLNTDNVSAPGDLESQAGSFAVDGFVTPGTYFVGAFVDDFNNQIPESDETNNQSAVIEITIDTLGPVIVDNGATPLGGFNTIDEAVNAANTGATITATPLNYIANPETVFVGRDNLTFDLAAGISPVLVLNAGLTFMTVQGAGSAAIFGNVSNNDLQGGDGNDTLDGGEGADTLDGGLGDNFASYAASTSRVEIDLAAGTGLGGWAQGDMLTNISSLFGSAFNDRLAGSNNADVIVAGDDVDNITGRGGNDLLFGQDGNDLISGGNNNDTIVGGNDDDRLSGNGGNDEIFGDQGEDTIFGGAGTDSIQGGDNDDEISGQGSADTIFGQDGADLIRGGSGNDFIDGGAQADLLFGNGNNDTILGGEGNDTLQGAAGADQLFGGGGDDTLTGGVGTDLLDGGVGNDVMNGGGLDGVRDTYVFALGYEQDRINTFDQLGSDQLQLDQDLWFATNPAFTEQEVIDAFGNLNGTGTILTLDFGGGDVLELQNAGGIDQSTLGTSVQFI